MSENSPKKQSFNRHKDAATMTRKGSQTVGNLHGYTPAPANPHPYSPANPAPAVPNPYSPANPAPQGTSSHKDKK